MKTDKITLPRYEFERTVLQANSDGKLGRIVTMIIYEPGKIRIVSEARGG